MLTDRCLDSWRWGCFSSTADLKTARVSWVIFMELPWYNILASWFGSWNLDTMDIVSSGTSSFWPADTIWALKHWPVEQLGSPCLWARLLVTSCLTQTSFYFHISSPEAIPYLSHSQSHPHPPHLHETYLLHWALWGHSTWMSEDLDLVVP